MVVHKLMPHKGAKATCPREKENREARSSVKHKERTGSFMWLVLRFGVSLFTAEPIIIKFSLLTQLVKKIILQ